MRTEIQEVLGAEIEVELIVGAEPTHLAPDKAFCRITEERTAKPVELVHSSGGSDARFICVDGTPVILSRPLVGNLHSVDEWIDINSMATYYQICQEFIRERLGLKS